MLAGTKFREALDSEIPLQLVGVINAMSALLAQSAGYKALYLSGAGVNNANLGLPDLNFSSLDDVVQQVRYITTACTLPLIVDMDTGWGSPLNVARSVQLIENAGAAGVHIEDQITHKRCGHRAGKVLVGIDEMCARLNAAMDAKLSDDFYIIARTDALAVEGPDETLKRALAYEACGVDALFLEGVSDLSTYAYFKSKLSIAILANITEFGLTPMFSLQELKSSQVDIALYPLGAFRMMNAAALDFYQHLRAEGTQKKLLGKMQTRHELYDLLDYESYEQVLDSYLNGVNNE